MSTRTGGIDRKINQERYNLEIEECLISIAMRLLAEKKYDISLLIFEAIIKLNPTYPEAYCGRGYALGFLGRYREALTAFDKAIQLDPDYPKAYCGRGEALCFLGCYSKAWADFDKAIQLNPNYQSAKDCKKMALNFLVASNKDVKVATGAMLGLSQPLARSKGTISRLSSTVSGNGNQPPVKAKTTNLLLAFANHLKRKHVQVKIEPSEGNRTDNPVDSRSKPQAGFSKTRSQKLKTQRHNRRTTSS